MIQLEDQEIKINTRNKFTNLNEIRYLEMA